METMGSKEEYISKETPRLLFQVLNMDVLSELAARADILTKELQSVIEEMNNTRLEIKVTSSDSR